MAVFCFCLFGNRLPVRNLRLFEDNLQLLVVLQPPFQGTEMELSLSVDDGLPEFLALLHHPCRVFLPHLQQGCHELLRVLGVLRFDGT